MDRCSAGRGDIGDLGQLAAIGTHHPQVAQRSTRFTAFDRRGEGDLPSVGAPVHVVGELRGGHDGVQGGDVRGEIDRGYRDPGQLAVGEGRDLHREGITARRPARRVDDLIRPCRQHRLQVLARHVEQLEARDLDLAVHAVALEGNRRAIWRPGRLVGPRTRFHAVDHLLERPVGRVRKPDVVAGALVVGDVEGDEPPIGRPVGMELLAAGHSCQREVAVGAIGPYKIDGVASWLCLLERDTQASPSASGAGAGSVAWTVVAASTSAAVRVVASATVVRGVSRHGASFLVVREDRGVSQGWLRDGVRSRGLWVVHGAGAPPSGVTTTSDSARQIGPVSNRRPGRTTGSCCGMRSGPYRWTTIRAVPSALVSAPATNDRSHPAPTGMTHAGATAQRVEHQQGRW